MGQPQLERHALGGRLAVLAGEPLEEVHEPVGNLGVGEVFHRRRGVVETLAEDLGDVEGELRIAREQREEVVGLGRAEQTLLDADGDGHARRLFEERLLAEDVARAEGPRAGGDQVQGFSG